MVKTLDTVTLENTVRNLTELGDFWKISESPIYMLMDGIPPGMPMHTVRLRNARITTVLVLIMECTGTLVTDDIIDQIVAFVERTASDDDFND